MPENPRGIAGKEPMIDGVGVFSLEQALKSVEDWGIHSDMRTLVGGRLIKEIEDLNKEIGDLRCTLKMEVKDGRFSEHVGICDSFGVCSKCVAVTNHESYRQTFGMVEHLTKDLLETQDMLSFWREEKIHANDRLTDSYERIRKLEESLELLLQDYNSKKRTSSYVGCGCISETETDPEEVCGWHRLLESA